MGKGILVVYKQIITLLNLYKDCKVFIVYENRDNRTTTRAY